MKPFIIIRKKFILGMYLVLSNISIYSQQPGTEAAKSPWGPNDEIGQLNLMTDQSRYSILQRIKSGKTFDLSVEYYKGMPGFTITGAPEYHYWLTRTPQGTVVDDPLNVGEKQNLQASYSADAILMPTHTGTHIDALVILV